MKCKKNVDICGCSLWVYFFWTPVENMMSNVSIQTIFNVIFWHHKTLMPVYMYSNMAQVHVCVNVLCWWCLLLMLCYSCSFRGKVPWHSVNSHGHIFWHWHLQPMRWCVWIQYYVAGQMQETYLTCSYSVFKIDHQSRLISLKDFFPFLSDFGWYIMTLMFVWHCDDVRV